MPFMDCLSAYRTSQIIIYIYYRTSINESTKQVAPNNEYVTQIKFILNYRTTACLTMTVYAKVKNMFTGLKCTNHQAHFP